MASRYDARSPYYNTPVNSYYLELMVNRPIPREPDDQLFRINKTYEYRPDLLAYDLYDSSRLWWVFAQRNPNTLQDPLNDFREGTEIYLPKMSTLRTTLGL